MNTSLDIAWALVGFLKVGGLVAALFGVAVFGWFFVRDNARAARGDSEVVPLSSWRGRGPMTGVMILAAGFVLTLFAIVLANMLHSRV